jgi:hypothetical protein
MADAELGPRQRRQFLDEAEIEAALDQTRERDLRDRGVAWQIDPVVVRLLADPADAVGALGGIADEHRDARDQRLREELVLIVADDEDGVGLRCFELGA